MTTGSILLGLALVLIVVALIYRPFLEPRYRNEQGSRRQALLDQKEALVEEIHQLDFDHETGKVPDLHFTTQRETLIREAAELLRELDAHGLSVPRAGAVDRRDGEIEAAIRQLRRRPDPAPANGVQPEAVPVPAVVAGAAPVSQPARPQTAPALAPAAAPAAAGFCPQCGQGRDADDKFCAFCGTQLS